MSWQQYVARHRRGRTQAELADLVDVSQTAVSRWLKGTQSVDAATAINFARAVGDDPLTALIEAGYLTHEEAGATPPPAEPDYSRLTNDELLDLVRARLREDGGGDDRDAAPIGAETGRASAVEYDNGDDEEEEADRPQHSRSGQ